MELEDRPSNLSSDMIPELTRPARTIIMKYKAKNRKPSGRKLTKAPRPAKYHNWHTPAAWSQIELAAKEAGPTMSASVIVAILKKRDPVFFARIRHSTINDWIDRSGPRARWTDAVQERIKSKTGNEPGHTKGGRRGILVKMLSYSMILN